MSRRLTDEERRLRALSEAEFRGQVNDLAEILGWSWMFVQPLRAAGGIWKTPTFGPLGKGWPDTTYVHDRRQRLLFVEFKRELEHPTDDQLHVHARLRAAGLEVYVWRPSDLDRITEVLR